MHLTRLNIILVLLLVSISCFSQMNPEYQLVKVKKNTTASTEVSSLYAVPKVVNSSQISYQNLDIDTLGNNQYQIVFLPEADYIGQVDLNVEYYVEGIFPGFPMVQYSVISHQVNESLVEAIDDVVIAENDSVNFFPLSNDNASESDLHISAISFSDGGTANINADGSIDFNFDSNSSIGYVAYISEDAVGTSDEGLVRLVKLQSANLASLEISLNNKENIDFYLGGEDFSVSQNASSGNLQTENGSTYTYIPSEDYEGGDYIEFTNSNNQICQIFLTVVEKTLDHSFLVDDYVYTSVNESTIFDVFENDLRTDYEIIDHSPELVYLGEGQFQYSPDTDEVGSSIFYYKVFTGLYFHTAQIFVGVDDFEPYGSDIHRFNVYDGTYFVLQHSAPISGYSFEVLTQPQHGILEAKSAGETLNSDCNAQTAATESVLEYFAEPGYEGIDAFEVNYCTPGGNCYIVKLEANVIPNYGSNCNCQVGCVWPGDFNNDGAVNMKDLIVFGANIGAGGIERGNNELIWEGTASDAWGFNAQSSNQDLMHLDANGDGYVTVEDAEAINLNYGLLNRLTSKEVHAITETPIILSTEQTEVDSGEWLYLDVSLGSAENPMIDFYGLTFNFNINDQLIDEESVCFIPIIDSYAYYDSPIVDNLQQPVPGNISVGVTRLTKETSSGAGVIAVLKFIVTDELDGFRDNDGKFEMRLKAEDALVYDQFGNAKALKSNEVTVDLIRSTRETKENIFAFSSTMYPNPASELLTIEANATIDNISIADASGKWVGSYIAGENQITIPTADLPGGIYFITVLSGDDKLTKKVSIINN